MKSFADLINKWPTVAQFARDVGVDYQTAKQWRRRESIPPKHWAAIVAAASGIKPKVNLTTLARIAAGKTARAKQ